MCGCVGRGWVLWCLICCEDSSSRTQQSPGWPSRPAESDTSSLCLVLRRALTAGTWCWAASPFIITRANHPQRAGLGGGLSYLCHPTVPPPYVPLSPLLFLLLLCLWPISRETKKPVSLSLCSPDCFCSCEQTNRVWPLTKENAQAHLILLP